MLGICNNREKIEKNERLRGARMRVSLGGNIWGISLKMLAIVLAKRKNDLGLKP